MCAATVPTDGKRSRGKRSTTAEDHGKEREDPIVG